MFEIHNFWNNDVYTKEGMLWGQDASNVAKKTFSILNDKCSAVANINNKILDVGCGYGRDCTFFFDNGLDVTGIDFSEKAIDMAIKTNPKIKYMVFNLKEFLPFEDAYFDLCYSNAVLQWFNIHEIRHIANELVRVSKTNGYIVIAVPIFGITPDKKNTDLIFSYEGTDLYSSMLMKLFYGCNKIEELRVKEYHEHGEKHEHDYYLVILKKCES